MATTISPISTSSFDVASYLNRIKGTAPVQPVTPVASGTPDTGATGASSTDTNNTVSTTGTGQVDLSSDVLSLLQSASPYNSSGNVISDLFDSSGNATSDYLSGLFGTVLFNYTSAKPLSQAITSAQAAGTSGGNAIQNLIASYQNVQNAASAQARTSVASEVRRILGGQDSIIA